MRSIIIFGDSITFGKGARLNLGWTSTLSKKFSPLGEHNAVYNQGISGDNSTHLLNRIETELKSRAKRVRPTDYHIVIIAIGMNDIRVHTKTNKPETTEKIFSSNINKCITYAKKYADKVIIIGITPVDDNKTRLYEEYNYTNSRIIKYNNLLKKEALKNKVYFLDYHSDLMKHKFTQYLNDGIHPNKKGYDTIFNRIYQFILKNNILPKK